MIQDIITRLSTEIAELEGRVEGAAELAELTSQNRLPQHATSAFVIPLGLIGREADAGAGIFQQMFEDTFAVIVSVRNIAPVGQRVLADLKAFLMSIIGAIAGWAPDDEVGVFRLLRGSLVSSSRGTLIYQIDFSITDQLRITP